MKKHSTIAGKSTHRSAPAQHRQHGKQHATRAPAHEEGGFVTATLLLSAEPINPPGRSITSFAIFGFEAPAALQVNLVGTFNNWNPEATPLTLQEDGLWMTELELPVGRYEYRFLVDGDWCDDPNASELVPNPFGSFNAVITV
jgi:1,4-alpha-glucan branching enzyme